MKLFKIRPSSIEQIIGGSIGLTDAQKARKEQLETIPKTLIGLTTKQLETLEKLKSDEKQTPVKEKKIAELSAKLETYKELTENQIDELAVLVEKEANPALPKSLISYCKKWYKAELTGKKGKNIDNKYTEKGTTQEDVAIALIAKVLGYGFLIKNEDRYSNDFITGTPDILPPNEVIDAKCSWDIDTFPMFETALPTMGYYWQLQGYMATTGRNRAILAYALVDTPDHLIDMEAYKECRSLGMEEVDADVYETIRKELTFSDLPDNLRIKAFAFNRNDADIQLIEDRVKVCRKYIKDVLVPMGKKSGTILEVIK